MTDEFLRNNYVPKVYQSSIHTIDYDKLKSSGVKLISFDIDETIAGNNEKHPPKTAVTLFENLKKDGFKIVLLTNAGKERGKHFGELLDVPYIYNAKKPLTKNFEHIMKHNNLKKNQMAHVGNNILDDVAGGNSAGVITCLVTNKESASFSKEESELRRELSKRKIWNGNSFYQLKTQKTITESVDERSLKVQRLKRMMPNSNQLNWKFPFFKKKESEPEWTDEVQRKLDVLYKEFFELTKKQSISIGFNYSIPKDTDHSGRFKSKLGGIPYWPESMKDQYPSNMILFAQINFAELPQLEGYPTSGMLQFFIDGWDWDDSIQKTIYHPIIDVSAPQMNIIRSTCNVIDSDAPFKGVKYLMSSKLEYLCMQPSNEQYDDTIRPLVKKHLGLDVKYLSDIPGIWYDYIIELIYNWGHRIGGYPNFTQGDVMDDIHNTLLLQIDSDKDMLWGDVGVSNIFINDKALVNKDFSNCLYHWDNY